jgi:hypothetical protein
MITVTELDFEKAHGPEDIINTGISPLIKLTEMLDYADGICEGDTGHVWALNYAIRAGLEDVEAALYKLDRIFRAKFAETTA